MWHEVYLAEDVEEKERLKEIIYKEGIESINQELRKLLDENNTDRTVIRTPKPGC